MTRTEFMKQLQDLLSDISKNEREEALQYYNDYFDDAGPEEEARILTELGSPEQVARKIKAGLSDDASEFSEQGYRDTRFDGNGAAPAASSFIDSESAGKTAPKKERNLWKLLAIVLLCIVLGPFVIPVGFGLLAVLFCVLLAALLTVALFWFPELSFSLPESLSSAWGSFSSLQHRSWESLPQAPAAC